ncbi:MAG: GIY-YIG nuclease family protein [Balneolaceae bacterium]
MHYLYILFSERIDQYYSGQTKDINDRLPRHNAGKSSATRKGVPWQLKKVVQFESKTEAIKAENWLKRMKSRRVMEQVIDGEIDMKKIIIG